MKKNLLCLLLALTMLLTLFAGCGTEPASDTTSVAEVSVEKTAEPTAQPAPEPAAPDSATEDSAADAETADFVPAEPLTYPLADGDVTFTILHSEPMLGPMSGQMNMSTYGDFETIAAGTEYIGVTPEWQSLSQMNGSEQFNLIAASGDYPDVWTAIDKYYAGGFQKAYEDEVIIKLDDYLEQDMPEYWNQVHESPELLKAVTNDDGEFMAWYSIYDKTVVNQGYFIRKDWCDMVGKEIPTTIDQLNEILYAVKDQTGYETVLLLGEGLDTLAEAWRVNGTAASGSGFAYHREGDTLVADIPSENYRSYIEQLHQWYMDGIVSKNFSELDTSNMSGVMEKQLAGNLTGVVNTMVNSMDNLVNDDPNFELAPIVVTVDGENIHTGTGERQFDSSSISSQCDESLIPYILGWMNYWYTEEGPMAGSYGVEGLDYEKDADGTIRYLPNITENELGYPPMLFSRARCFSGAAFGLMYQDRTVPFFTEAQNNAIEVWTSRTDSEGAISNALCLSPEEGEIVSLYATDLATYVAEEVPKFVTGDRDFTQWDTFIETCEGMHLDELLAAYQGAYDRFVEK